MKKSLLSILICAAVTGPVHAQTTPDAEFAQDGVTYSAIIVKLKPTKAPLKSSNTAATTATSTELTLSDPSLAATPIFRSNKLRSTASGNDIATDARYGFDRYRRIELTEDKSTDKNFINHVISELEHNPNVEIVYPESMPVSLDEIGNGLKARQLLKSTPVNNAGAAAVPDLRDYRIILIPRVINVRDIIWAA